MRAKRTEVLRTHALPAPGRVGRPGEAAARIRSHGNALHCFCFGGLGKGKEAGALLSWVGPGPEPLWDPTPGLPSARSAAHVLPSWRPRRGPAARLTFVSEFADGCVHRQGRRLCVGDGETRAPCPPCLRHTLSPAPLLPEPRPSADPDSPPEEPAAAARKPLTSVLDPCCSRLDPQGSRCEDCAPPTRGSVPHAPLTRASVSPAARGHAQHRLLSPPHPASQHP